MQFVPLKTCTFHHMTRPAATPESSSIPACSGRLVLQHPNVLRETGPPASQRAAGDWSSSIPACSGRLVLQHPSVQRDTGPPACSGKVIGARPRFRALRCGLCEKPAVGGTRVMASGRTAARGGSATENCASISKWKSVLSRVGSSLSSLCPLDMFQRAQKKSALPRKILRDRAQSNISRNTEWPFPQFISLFFPVFTFRSQRLEQEFQDIELITKGSIGPILKVCKRTDEQTYALKVLLKTEILRQQMLQQCKEGVTLQQVHHPFVQGLRECWQTSRLLFIMFDYHSAGDLNMLWRGCHPLEEDTVRVFAAELGSAIGFLHDFGVIHRDVKMENVLLNERGHLKLTDFGFSRRLCRGERAYTICGTMQYMAPEVLQGGPYGHAADWWSLGVLLFALLIGKFPVEPQCDHTSMLLSVERTDMKPPSCVVSQALSFLLTEVGHTHHHLPLVILLFHSQCRPSPHGDPLSSPSLPSTAPCVSLTPPLALTLTQSKSRATEHWQLAH
ncbi:ribosomal protein S6 kinase-related protein-like isoform X2 [Chiloscyllium plagiosum]|uniref:ribosomal protein S6 kinase-related protein-like isoform X2 n=1 Tax=Chiloscyllium plagiosum TaxID=36176 RepID=UPI001CB812BF|nr:ribosomal protein S6 kinase-related protein-like isoform X2 [Chiloscyllium plagiosum]